MTPVLVIAVFVVLGALVMRVGSALVTLDWIVAEQRWWAEESQHADEGEGPAPRPGRERVEGEGAAPQPQTRST